MQGQIQKLNMPKFASKVLEKYYRRYKQEQMAYTGAFLSQIRQQYQSRLEKELELYPEPEQKIEIYDSIYEYILNTIEEKEHWQLAQSDHLQQLFEMLNNINSVIGGDSHVVNKRYEQFSDIVDIIDPNKFPIFGLIDKLEYYQLESVWNFRPELKRELEKRQGYSLRIDQSSLDHHMAGQGVFIDIFNEQKSIVPGTLLGLVPGIIYDELEDPILLIKKQYKNMNEMATKPYLQRSDNKVLDFSAKLPYPLNKQTYLEIMTENQQRVNNDDIDESTDYVQKVDPEWVNPYAIGHKINHPMPQQQPNCILLDITIPEYFFDLSYLRHLPVIDYSDPISRSTAGQGKRVVGLFSIQELEDNQELFIDYIDVPDWLQDCEPINAWFEKYEYQYDMSLIIRVFEIIYGVEGIARYKDIDRAKLEYMAQKSTVGYFNRKIR